VSTAKQRSRNRYVSIPAFEAGHLNSYQHF